MRTVMQVVHTGLVWLVVSVATAVGAGLVLVSSLLPRSLPFQLLVTRWWARLCLLTCACRLRIEGLDRLDLKGGRYVIMANHQSAFDIPVLMAILPVPWQVSVWAKRSLFSVPFLGWAMRTMGFVAVDREQRSTATRTLTSSLRKTIGGRSALIFPEETYSTGGKLLPFQRGGFLLAFRAGLPILPIGIHGTPAVLKPDTLLLRPARVTVRLGTPIDPAGVPFSQRAQLAEQVRCTIAELSGLEP